MPWGRQKVRKARQIDLKLSHMLQDIVAHKTRLLDSATREHTGLKVRACLACLVVP